MYLKPKLADHPGPPKTSKEKWSRRFQYLYFLRFCLLGSLLLPLLCVLDYLTGVSALSRGIITLTTGWQAFHAVFFVVTFATTTLVCARNIVMNGNSRFVSQPPMKLYEWMTSTDPKTLWTVLAAAQIPALITLWYVIRTTIAEQVGFAAEFAHVNGDPYARTWPYEGHHLILWGWCAFGLTAAFTFWYLITLFYLWTHEWESGEGPRALIFPPLLPKVEDAIEQAKKPQLAEWLELALKLPLKFTQAGYAPNDQGPLWELHFLATVSLIAFLVLYLFLFLIVAPVLTTTNPWAETTLAVAIFFGVLLGSRESGSLWRMEKPGIFFSIIFVVLLGILVYRSHEDIRNHYVWLARSFPVLASVSVILIFVQWAINGASFFFDRYRVPVLTSAIAIIFLPKFALSFIPQVSGTSRVQWIQSHVVDWDADHYFEARKILPVKKEDLPDPTKAVAESLVRTQNDDGPLVVITATGGGIQAAEWTAQVLAKLELAFAENMQLNGYQLHDHLLLASGVSGGSYGLLPYLLEYTRPKSDAFVSHSQGNGDIERKLLHDRLTIGPGCSSLEAVAWGLEYYDLQRLVLTLRFPLLQSAQDSPDYDPNTMVAPDRTWALSRAFNRNLRDRQCGASLLEQQVADADGMTLGQAAKNLNDGTMPAFTLNTTVAETGGRFLLSNYQVPSAALTESRNNEFLPAESFLQAYAQDSCCPNGPDGTKLFADLPMSTAARMSATFPIVSSATRVPRQFAKAGSHFLDGGYFDNDGTGSAIEFLYSVMNEKENKQIKLKTAKQNAPPPKPLNVLLVEIRDGEDMNPNLQQDDLQDQNHYGDTPAPWWTLNQLLGPLYGLWNASHNSITRRNRRELCELETAYSGDLNIHHVVFPIPLEPNEENKTKASPLSWKLTASQLAYITSVASGKDAEWAVENAMQWVRDVEKSAQTSEPLPAETCTVYSPPERSSK